MPSPLEIIAARLGVPVSDLRDNGPSADSPVADKHDEVKDSPEMRRILALPRRPAPGPEQQSTRELAAKLTSMLARHANPYPGPLNLVQAAALHEAWAHGGLLAPIRVGGGKTLLSYLLPAVLGARRPVIVAPAALEKDYDREVVKLSQHWRGPHPSNLPFISYERLSSKNAGARRDSKGALLREELLERLQPDLLVFDEVHKVRNHTAVCTKRVKRYLQAHPDCKVAAMSGSLTRRSVKDFAHIARWCLRERCPVPTTYSDLEAWASALDELDSLAPRADVGALTLLCSEQEKARIAATRGKYDEDEATRRIVRGAVQRRLVETPGVVGTRDGPLSVPLEISELGPAREDPAINDAFESMRLRWELPGEAAMPVADGLEMARHAKTLGCGYFLDYQPRPPETWLDTRRDWAGYCRDVVRYNRMHIDSEAQVKDAIRAGLLKDKGLLARWESVAPAYIAEDHAVVEWLSHEAVETAKAWAERNRGIIWVGNIALGIALERELRVPFYGAEGMSRAGNFILDHPHGQPMIASKQANGTGRNLQKGWAANLFFTTPGEQVIGRTHRQGQDADKVTCDLFIGCAEHISAFEKELAKAHYAQQLTGDAQRLVYAAKTLPTSEEVAERDGYRWRR